MTTTTTHRVVPDVRRDLPGRSRSLTLGLLVSAQFVVMLDTPIVNVALPSSGRRAGHGYLHGSRPRVRDAGCRHPDLHRVRCRLHRRGGRGARDRGPGFHDREGVNPGQLTGATTRDARQG